MADLENNMEFGQNQNLDCNKDPDHRWVCSLFDDQSPGEGSLHKIHTRNFSITRKRKTRKRETQYSVSRFHVAFSSTISTGGGGARCENVTCGVVSHRGLAFSPMAQATSHHTLSHNSRTVMADLENNMEFGQNQNLDCNKDPDHRWVCSLFDDQSPGEGSLHKIHTSMSRIGVVEVA
ncbi:hypothetical protein Tco_1340288 [Tanacetum coccineum]